MIEQKLVDLLVCPLTHDRLRLEGDRLVNVRWGIRYPIRNGIPVMLLDEAEWPEGIENLEQMTQRIRQDSDDTTPPAAP